MKFSDPSIRETVKRKFDMAKTPKKTAMAIPSSKVDIKLTAGSVEPAMKAAEAKSTKLYRVPVASIKTIPGFNVRVQSADYIAHRDMIADSIRTNGFDQTKPLAGYVAKEGDKNVIYVTDGHTRLDAVEKLNADDTDAVIQTLPVLVHPADKSLTDLTVALHTSNTGRPLTPFELGVVVKRLMKDEGADKAEIASRLAVTPRYLDDVLLLVNGPKEVRTAVLEGQVSSTLAIQELRKDPEKAVEKITAAVAKSGGSKVTKKALGPKMQKVKSTVSIATGTDMKEIVKAVAALVRKAIPASTPEDEDAIKEALVDGTINLVIEVPAPEKPAAKPKAKPAAKKAAAKKAPAKKAAEPAADKPEKAPAKKKGSAKPKAEKPPVEEDDDNLTAEDDDDLGIDGAEVASDGEEIAIIPPAVKNGEGVDDDADEI
jgi:hypothetical protein